LEKETWSYDYTDKLLYFIVKWDTLIWKLFNEIFPTIELRNNMNFRTIIENELKLCLKDQRAELFIFPSCYEIRMYKFI